MHNNITIDSHCLGAQPSVIKNHGSNCPQMKRQIKECYFSCISYLVQNKKKTKFTDPHNGTNAKGICHLNLT